jgi:hypothetical protein
MQLQRLFELHERYLNASTCLNKLLGMSDFMKSKKTMLSHFQQEHATTSNNVIDAKGASEIMR